MKLHVLVEHLQKKISFLNHGVSSKSQLPILLNFLLEAKRGEFSISSTDLEIGIRSVIPANIEEEGTVVVSARKFSDLVNYLSPGKITLLSQNQTLELVGAKTKSIFQTTPKEEFPALYEEMGEILIESSEEELIKTITPVSFAASIDAARPALSGILVKKEETGFLLVATDGYRLSIQHAPYTSKKKPTDEKRPILVPARVFKEALLMKDEGTVSIYVSYKNKQVAFAQGKTTLVGRLIEAEFPNYQKIIPSSFESSIEFDRQELMQAVKTASVFARESANIVRFVIKKDTMTVSANAPSVGENTVEIEASLKGEENEIAFNSRYLLDFLSSIEEEDLILQITGPLSPGIFKIKNNESFLHIIMPIRVQG